jgi:hypothetical protein
MDNSLSILSGKILPVNGKPLYTFSLKNLHKITLTDWPPSDYKLLGWEEAQEEMNKHWDVLSNVNIWAPYPIQAYTIGSSQAPMLINALSKREHQISSLVQQNLNEYLTIEIRYFLFPLKNSRHQSQAVAQLICETLPDANKGDVNAWVDALRENELQDENIKEIDLALKEIN